MKIKVAPGAFKSLEWHPIRHAYNEVRFWFHIHFRKANWGIFKEWFKGDPLDYGFLLSIEQAKIKDMLDYFEKHDKFVGQDIVMRDMRICISLLDIMLEKRQLFHHTGSIYITDDGELKSDNLQHHCDVYVNLKNINRFVDEELTDFYTKFPDELYIQKARHLYYKIRYERDQHWWL